MRPGKARRRRVLAEKHSKAQRSQGAVPEAAGPGERLLAQAARTRLALGDDSARHTLAALLLAEDEVARQLAFEALRRRFGDDRGYDPASESAARREEAANWME